MLLLAGCGGVHVASGPSAPGLSISATSLVFPATTAGQTSASQTVTVTNSGSASLTLATITLSDTKDYSMTSTCGATLAAGATCGLTVTFTPVADSPYTSSITVTANAPGGPWIVSLSGLGKSVVVTHTMYVFPETDGSITPIYALVNGAQTSIDLSMWALTDPTFSGDLVAACNRGVKVRVALDQTEEMSDNTPAFNQLNAVPNCSAVWANLAFDSNHQKSFVVDETLVAIMSLNLQAVAYTSTRDYAMVENDPEDIAAIEATFNEDYAAGTTAAGVAGASDFGYQPGLGDTSVMPGGDLIWSPTNSQADMLAIINNAKSTLLVEAEEMDAPNITSALVTACENHIQVHIVMTDDPIDYGPELAALQAAGCGLFLYPNLGEYSGLEFYVHAKATIADYGLPTQVVYMGSINYDIESMTENRELGMYVTDPASIQLLYKTMASDYAGKGTLD
ncbi:MAG TPA: phospholipase D-like domain-containing protein [Terracidiphilus sp.]